MSFQTDDNRVYGYVRFETGDEMSRRAKFAFITWIGPSVGPLKKAAVSTDKAFVKQIWVVSIFLSYCELKQYCHVLIRKKYSCHHGLSMMQINTWIPHLLRSHDLIGPQFHVAHCRESETFFLFQGKTE